jgi:hypothetical protein
MTRLKLYSDRSWLLPGCEDAHVTALTPFWGRTSVQAAAWPDYADELIAVGHEFLELTDLENSDVAVFPVAGRILLDHPEGPGWAREFTDLAASAGKPSAFFFDPADAKALISQPFPAPDADVFRGSLYASRRGRREFAFPLFHDDVGASTGAALTVRRKGRPIISFCGQLFRDQHEPPKTTAARARRAVGNARRFAWRLQGRHEEDLFVRAKAVDALLEQDAVATSIIVRESNAGGNWPNWDQSRWERARREFLENILDSDYVLCARGDGNCSIRVYETLCLGRIPVIVDTDLVMPYDFLLPWRDYGVWIDRSEVGNIGAKVAEFHEGLGEREFEDLQRECRRLWEQYLSPVGFFRHFHRHFER